MRILITALTLAFFSNASFANGFNPWESRNVAADVSQETSVAKLKPIGFAPWNRADSQEFFSNQTEIAAESVGQNIFRPWS